MSRNSRHIMCSNMCLKLLPWKFIFIRGIDFRYQILSEGPIGGRSFKQNNQLVNYRTYNNQLVPDLVPQKYFNLPDIK